MGIDFWPPSRSALNVFRTIISLIWLWNKQGREYAVLFNWSQVGERWQWNGGAEIYNVEEDQASVISKKKKNEKDNASITSTKNIMTHLKKYINQGKMLMKESTHILPPQKIR